MRAIVAAVQLPSVDDVEFDASLTELRQLAKTLGFEVIGRFTQKRASFESAAYFGAGKREELRELVQDEAQPADLVLIDHEISPSQTFALAKELGCEVMDRTMVILEIFHRHARSRAARAQVEIARLGYMAPRLREAAKQAGPKDRARSGTGGRSGGESHGELDRRKIRDRIAELQKELDATALGRRTQRARRQERQGLARVALVGYTNAGKSTLMRALTGNEVLVADKLFATLDTTVRALHPESLPRVLVSDTVGFIKNLPHGLVASFKSTLDEALEASLLAHVVDASDPGFERQLAVTDEVLDEIGAKAVPRLLVFNKIDRAGDAAAQGALEASLRARYPECIVMSARRESDIAKLRNAMVAFFERDLLEAELFLPWSAQSLRGEVFASCKVLAERADDEGTILLVRGDPETVTRLREQFGLAKDK
jgi:GTPase